MNCYLCDSSNPTTRDHVPPKGFFPDPKPSNLITLPCCAACNNSYSKDDEAMRVWLSIGLGYSESAEWVVKNKVFPGTLSRSPSFRADILNSMQDTTIIDEDGKPMDVVKYSMNRERVEKFVIRVTKGLLRHYFPDHDYFQDHWNVLHMGLKIADHAKIEPLRDNLHYYDSRGDHVIQYRFGFAKEGLTGVWLVLFYGTALFTVIHRKGEPLLK